MVQVLCEIVWQFSKRLDWVPTWLSNFTHWCEPKRHETYVHTDTYTQTFIAALLTVAKRWKQTKYPSADQWINKMWLYPYGRILFGSWKETKCWYTVPLGWTLEVKEARHKKPHIVWFHLRGMSRIDKSIERGRSVFALGWRFEGKWGSDENVL